MKKILSLLSLAALTVGLLGSCSKINERIDNLEKKVDGIESNQIASIKSQVDAINTSIADLGTIRQNVQTLMNTTPSKEDIEELRKADEALGRRIDELKSYTDGELTKYATTEWVKATFATLEQHQWTCDTIAKIDARIGALDAKLSQSISGLESSLKQWVNEQLDAYYTAAQMDAKLDVMRNDINNAKAQGKTATDKADSLATELTTLKTAVDSAKANIRSEYKAAVQSAIETAEGKLTKALKDSIAAVNGRIEALDTRVTDLESRVLAVEGNVNKLLAMIQSMTIVPAYNDGSVEAVDSILTLKCIVSPAEALIGMESLKDSLLIYADSVKVKTKGASAYMEIEVSEASVLDTAQGAITLTADISEYLPKGEDKALTVAVNIKNGISDFTTKFVPVTVSAAKPIVEYVEIAAKYNGSTVSTLRWYRQSLAITDSGNKAWKGGSGSAVKVPGTGEDVVVGDYFPWGTFAGLYGSGADSDKGLLPYSAFTNTGCGDGLGGFTFKDDKQFKKENTPYWSGSAYTKYNATDGKTVLEASDDVASIVLGGTWRMPTQAEFQAMKEATYWAWDATDKGYYVYAPNPATDAGKVNNGTGTYDKSEALLFFPATGYGGDTSMSNAGTNGYYRSSTLYSEDTKYAYRPYFYADGVNPNAYTDRYFGFSVRPVQDPAATYVAVTNVSLDVTAKEIEEGGNVQLKVTVAPATATQNGVYWTSDKPAVATVDATGKVTAVAAGTATITVTTVDGTKTATCTVTVLSPKPYVEIAAKYNGSTTTTLKWYRQNLAITGSGQKAWTDDSGSAVKVPGMDEDVVVGDYFQWGTFTGFYGNGDGTDKGLLPYTSFTSTGCGDGSDAFTFKDGKQFNQTNAPYWSGSAYTKYNTTDGKTELDASDDVASIILGGTWRMPTSAEIIAMKAATYWKWDATDKGYYVFIPLEGDEGKINNETSNTYNKADALLFFPTAGNGYENMYYDVESIADYWASSLNSTSEKKPCYACHLFFNSSGSVNADSRESDRYRGYSVRPVQDPAAKYEAVTNVSLDITAKEIEEGGNVQLKVTVAPATATQPGVYWTSSAPTVATVDATGKVTAVAAGTATITATTVDGSKTATCTVTVTAPIVPEGFVDLGVKDADGKSLYWAEKNLGATNPQDDGDYFSWGETAPNYTTTGGWPATPAWKEGKTSGYSWNSYCGQSSFVEWSTPPYDATSKILLPAYDAATKTNSSWRTPTRQEFTALAVNCVWVWTENYNSSGKAGYIVYKAKNDSDKGKAKIGSTWEKWDTSKNKFVKLADGDSEPSGYTTSDAHIFFPSGGQGDGTTCKYGNLYGNYWSSTIYPSKDKAYDLRFNNGEHGIYAYEDSNPRYYGFSVRPVTTGGASDPGNGTEQYNNNSNPDWF